MKKLVFLISGLLFGHGAFAAQSNNSNFASSSQVQQLYAFHVLANDFASYSPGPPPFTDVNIVNKVGVMIDHSSTVYWATKLDYTFNLQLTSFLPGSTTGVVQNIALNVVYDPLTNSSHQDQNIYSFSGYVKVVVQIMSITDNSNGSNVANPVDLFMVKAEVNIERYYVLDYTVAPLNLTIAPISTPAPNPITYEYLVSWDITEGAEEYDLEWTWVNTYTGTYATYSDVGKNYNFRFNSSRVRVTGNNFAISNVFDHGYLIVRVRSVGRNPGDWSKLLFSAWSIPEEDLLSNLGSTDFVEVEVHEAAMNWQYSASFAEEGKKKEIVSYFDGSLRSRQMVTKINTSGEVIVGEAYYDHQGRKALEALPVPTPEQNAEIRFYPEFNRNPAQVAYSRNDFDLDESPGACLGLTSPFHNDYGAGNYYSEDNVLVNTALDPGFNAYLPDADGFPFIRTEYTPDNTGRIRRQGGVGINHQLDSNHETRYYYGKPLQFEIDRLFGNEAGYSIMYKKDMVVDPNGQVSISYKDLGGKVIATALAGNTPSNVDVLPSVASASVLVEADLLEKEPQGESQTNRITQNGNALEFNTHFLVSQPGVYDFAYSVTAPAYTNDCLNPSICFDCIYDLTIRITDSCGVPLEEQTVFVGNPTLDNTCEEPLISYSSATADPISLTLSVGSYQIYKSLTINHAAMEYYLAQLTDSTKGCFKTRAMFVAEELAAVDDEGCDITCEECAEALGTRDEYVLRGLGNEKDWELAYENCMSPCASVSKCQTFLRLMLSDVSPGGQYAEWFDTTTHRMNTARYPLSVFNQHNYLPDVASVAAFWRNPFHINLGVPGYYDENGSLSKILLYEIEPGIYLPEVSSSFIGSDGNRYAFPDKLLHEADFIYNWKNSWAYSLVQYHPEFCYYEWCDVNDTRNLNHTSSEDFDELLITTDYLSQAVTLGIDATPGDLDPFLDNDPYFALGGRGFTQKTTMATILGDPDYEGTGYSIFQLAANAARCPGEFKTGPPAPTCLTYGAGLDSNVWNEEWKVLRSMYLGEKEKMKEIAVREYVKASCSKGLNTCIGEAAYNYITDGYNEWDSPNPMTETTRICGYTTSRLYQTKTKRYVLPRDLKKYTPGMVAYDHYYLTGQCPDAMNIQLFLQGLIKDNKLITGHSLNNKPYFLKDIYEGVNGGITGTYTPYTYVPTISGTNNEKLTIEFKDPGLVSSSCSLSLQLPYPYLWGQVVGMYELHPRQAVGDPNAFSMVLLVNHDANPITLPIEIEAIGTSTCFNIGSCTFETQCIPTQTATDLMDLMNALLHSNPQDLLNTTGVLLDGTAYDPFIDPLNAITYPLTILRYWKYTSGVFTIYSSDPNENDWIDITLTGFEPSSFLLSDLGSIEYFSSIIPDPQNQHGFLLEAYYDHDSDPTTPPRIVVMKAAVTFTNVDIDGPVFGLCTGRQPQICNTPEHRTGQDLERFINALFQSPPVTTTLPVTSVSYWTDLLQGQLGLEQYSIGLSESYDDSLIYHIMGDQPGVLESVCKLRLFRIDPYFKERQDFADIVTLRQLEVRPDLLIDGKAYSFTILAEYPNGVTERIGGSTSCFPVKDCGCPKDYGGEGGIGEGHGNKRECSAMYRLYVQNMQFFNDGNFQNNPNGLQGEIVSEENFNCDCVIEYLKYLKTYEEDPGNPFKSMDVFCEGFPCSITFQTYKNAVLAYRAAHPEQDPELVLDEYTEGEVDCDCLEQYLNYLASYTGTGAPKSLITFITEGLCIADDDCEALAEHYQNAVLAFNGSPYRNREGYTLPVEEITPDLCSCLLAYSQYLNSYNYGGYVNSAMPMSLSEFVAAELCGTESSMMMMGGGEQMQGESMQNTDSFQMVELFMEGQSLYIESSSLYQPTYVGAVNCPRAFIHSPLLPYVSRCEAHLQHVAEVNGNIRYERYLEEFLATHTALYTEHCLEAVEEVFTTEYTDKTYHYTLYYYDQAGNLIRTVPPEGVKMLDNSAMVPVALDRYNKTRKTYTSHKLVTTYEYNSLNQLIRQGVPDHDKMNRWYVSESNPAGALPAGFIATSSFAMSSASTMLVGTLNGKGYIYRSDDAGKNWYRMGAIFASDLNELQMVDASVGFAIGKDGLLYQTADGGDSWLIVPGALGVVTHLNDLYFKSATEGVVVGDNGLVKITSNGGTSWTNSATSISGDIQSISAFNTTTLLLTVNLADQGHLYKSTNFGTNWTEITSFQTAGFNDICMVNSTDGFAAGNDGLLVQTTDAGVHWNLVASGQQLDFQRIYFKDASKGFAILGSGSAGGNLYATSDGGATWTQASAIGTYRDFSFYSNDQGYAVGNSNGKGILAKLDVTLLKVSKLADRFDLADNLYAVHFIDANTGFVGGNSGKLFACTNASSAYMSWTAITLTGYTTENIRDLHFSTTSAGVLITESGKMIRTTNGGSSFTLVNAGSENFVFLDAGTTHVYAVDDNAYGTIWEAIPTTLSFSVKHAYSNTENPGSASLKALSANGSIVFVTGDAGILFKGLTVQSKQTVPLAFTDVYAVPATTSAFACGVNGSLWVGSTTGDAWQQLITPTLKQLNTVEFTSPTVGLIGGNDGILYAYSSGTLTTIPLGTGRSILDIDYLNSSAVALSGTFGLLKVSANGGSTWSDAGAIGFSPIMSLNGVSYVASGSIIATGGMGTVWRSNGSVLEHITDLILPALSDVHFSTMKKGVIVGEDGSLLTSEAGGISWFLRPPMLGVDFKSAVRISSDVLVVSDQQNKIWKGNGSGAGFTTVHTGSNILNDISFADLLHGVAVGNNGTILYTTNGGTSWTAASTSGAVSSNLYSVQMRNEIGFLAGASGMVLTAINSGANWTIQNSGTSDDLFDVFFHDDFTGYVVGENGQFRKSIDGGLIWTGKDNNMEGLPAGTDHLYTLSFNTRFDGFFGGDDYHRRLNDEADLFSGFFYFDNLGRLTVSENTKQFNRTDHVYSYTLFDPLGRIAEVGELTQTADVRTLYENRLMDTLAYRTWVTTATSRKEVTRAYYDRIIDGTLSISGFTQNNLRKRVASVSYEDVDDGNNLTYTNASHFDYDIHGNVRTLIQDIPALQTYGREHLRMDYEYDLVSGNVKAFHYQSGEIDQWHHRYLYDADNRIQEVQTSRDQVIWDVDARYEYYRHGALARTEVGDLKVQGIDLAYTLHGWLKGVNSNTLSPNEDMGQDGGTYAPHTGVARDAFGFTLGYYTSDYKAVGGMNPGPGFFVPSASGSEFLAHSDDLMNGNIGRMVTSIIDPNSGTVLPQGYAYQYDQLNRLKQMRAFSNFNLGTNSFNAGGGTPVHYGENFTYDANGNILTLNRSGAAGNTSMDNLTYRYDYFNNDPADGMRSNRLYHVNDGITSTYTDDIDDMGTFTPASTTNDINALNNYGYDEMGNLVRDEAEEIEEIEWTLSGKIKRITRTVSSTKPDLEFVYDAMGQRVAKIEQPKPATGTNQKLTWYALDAQGNSIVVYDEHYETSNSEYYLIADERNIYGSVRMGMQDLNDTVYGSEVIPPVANYTERILGKKKYEGTNHLGNVLAVVSDKRIPRDPNTNNVIDYYDADIRGSYDYYSFGSPMPDRTFVPSSCSTQTVIQNNYTHQDNFPNPLPLWNPVGTAGVGWAGPGAMTVNCAVATDGAQQALACVPGVQNTLDLTITYGNNDILIDVIDPATMLSLPGYPILYPAQMFGTVQNIQLLFIAPPPPLPPGLPNVIVRITSPGGPFPFPDMFIVNYVAISTQTSIQQQVCWDEDYRFGFNGMEKDNEVSGVGNSFNTEFRQYDPRLGRWFSKDLVVKPWESPYAGFANNPIYYVDPKGLDPGSDDVIPGGEEDGPSMMDDGKGQKPRELINYGNLEGGEAAHYGTADNPHEPTTETGQFLVGSFNHLSTAELLDKMFDNFPDDPFTNGLERQFRAGVSSTYTYTREGLPWGYTFQQIENDIRKGIEDNIVEFSFGTNQWPADLNSYVRASWNYYLVPVIDNPAYCIPMGGIQKIVVTAHSVSVTRIPSTAQSDGSIDPEMYDYTIVLSVELWDNFGVDEGDFADNDVATFLDRDGLTAFWILQQQRGFPPVTVQVICNNVILKGRVVK